MARKRVSEKKSKEIRRLASIGLSKREIARALQVHRRTVDRHLLEPEAIAADKRVTWVDSVDWETLIAEEAKGVAAKVLWEELKSSDKVPVSYQNFMAHLRKHRRSDLDITMRRRFKPGDRIEIDYCDGIDILDPITGNIVKTHLFAGVLCYSRYTFAEFSLTQKSGDFLESHKRMFDFFQGVSQIISPDNLKSAVIKAHKYEPDLNQAYQKLAEHYQCGVVPARVRKPKDKAIVERNLQIFQRWFYGKVRHRTFTSLGELNQTLRSHLTEYNALNHRLFKKSRTEMFEEEKAYLKSLPESVFQVKVHNVATVHPDCHISFDGNYYSVPYQLSGNKVDIWASSTHIEVYSSNERVALHPRVASKRGKFQTKTEHYPERIQAYKNTSAQNIRNMASRVGPQTSKLIHLLLGGENPLTYLRRCQGIVRLSHKYGPIELEKACEYALSIENHTYKFIERALKKPNLTNYSPETPPNRGPNSFLRGPSYFTKLDRGK